MVVTIKAPGGEFEDYEPNGVQTHSPPEISLEEGRYITYDETPLQNDLAVLRPIYPSATPSADTVPESDWSG